MANEQKIGALLVEISANIAKYQEAMKKTQAETQSMVTGVKNQLNSMHGHFNTLGSTVNKVTGVFATLAGVVAGGALFRSVVQETVNWTSGVVKLSKTLGITTESASALQVAIRHLGLDSDMVATASLRIAKTMGGNEKAFQSLGVATRDQNGHYRDSMTVMTEVNAKLNDLKAGTDRNVAGIAIYGRSWGEVQNILKLTSKELADAKAKAEQLHLLVGPEGAAKIRTYKEGMNDLSLMTTALKVNIGNELIPTLTGLGAFFSEYGPTAVGIFAQAMVGLARVTAESGVIIGANLDKFRLFYGLSKQNMSKGNLTGAVLSSVPLIGSVYGMRRAWSNTQSYVDAKDQIAAIDDAAASQFADIHKRFSTYFQPGKFGSTGGGSSYTGGGGKTGKGSRAKKAEDLPSAYAMLVKDAAAFAKAWEEEQKKLREDAEWISDQKNNYASAMAKVLQNEHELGISETARKLTLLDTAEAFHEISRAEAADQRLKLNEELLAQQQQWLELTGQGADAVIDQARKVKQSMVEVLAASDNMLAGAGAGLTQYADGIPSMFESARDGVKNAFEGMEDALVDFVMTGKFQFSDLANSILADIARITIRQNITGPLASMLGSGIGSLFGASSVNIDTWGGLPGGLLGGYATGTNYVPETGPYLLHKGEAVIPADKNSGGLTINVPVSVAGNNALASDLRNEIERTVIDVVRRHS